MRQHRFGSMGCEIVVGGATDDEARAVQALFEERDRVFSPFRDDSDLTAVNEATGPVLVSELFARTLRIALDAAAATEGLVDPTLGAVSVRLSGRVLAAKARLDLNGVVKSLAADDAVALLSGPGFVSAGGDIATSRPLDVALPGGGAVRLVRGGVATSGTAKRGAHLIDPRTRRPSRSRWTHVTVAGRTCVAADVAAKAAFLHGDDGPAWLDTHGIPGRFVAEDEIVVNESWRACT